MKGYAYVINAFDGTDETVVFSTLEKAVMWLKEFLVPRKGGILNAEPQVNGDIMVVYEYSDDLKLVSGVVIIEKCKVF